jgi:hypothetical protein
VLINPIIRSRTRYFRHAYHPTCVTIIFLQKVINNGFQFMTGYAVHTNMGGEQKVSAILTNYSIELTSVRKLSNGRGHCSTVRVDAPVRHTHTIRMYKQEGMETVFNIEGILLPCYLPQNYITRGGVNSSISLDNCT